MIQLIVARSCHPTGDLLRTELESNGVRVGSGGNAVVCWGAGYSGNLPSLNGKTGSMDKYQQFVAMRGAGVPTPLFFPGNVSTEAVRSYPLLARKKHHHGGTDIMLILQKEDLALRRAAGAEFFVQYIPRMCEYRVWIYRRRHLGTYQKVLRHPEQYTKVGCNFDNGFAFDLARIETVPRAAIDASMAAVDSLGLDFGAVDVLMGTDHKAYVLEVNTAPGVEGPRQGFAGLVNHVVRWVGANYTSRRSDVPTNRVAQRYR